MIRFSRHPAVHFLAIGGALFALESWRAGAGQAAPAAIVVSGARVAEIRRTFAIENGRPPSAAEERSLVDGVIDEEVLHREARMRHLDRDDPVVRQRLLNVMGFIAEDGEDGSEEEQLARASELGIDRKDVVVRRHLVASMRLLAGKAARPSAPADEELREVLERHRDELTVPTTMTMSHVFVSREKRGAALERDAAGLLGKLRREHVRPERVGSFGDGFLLGARFAGVSSADLARLLGDELARRTFALDVGEWSGPYASPYGLHLVYVEERTPPALPSFESLRPRLRAIFEREREDERVRAWLRSHRAGYAVRVEPAIAIERAVPGDLSFPLPRKRAELGD